MPRRSAASLAVIPPVSGAPPRLTPPPELGERERVIFLDLVTSLPANHFAPSDVPLLARYCEAAALAERAALALRDAPMTVDGRPNPLITVHGGAVKSLLGLSLKLRLSPQARTPNQPRRPVRVSVYERMALEANE
jgi:phage terminase small subunit